MHLFLVRHGETVWNVERRCQGHTDIPLNEKGLEQAEKLGRYLQNVQLDAVYASDLSRARQTAEKIAQYHRLNVQTMPALRERHYGEWEGLTVEEINERYPDQLHVRRAGGVYGIETFADLQGRVFNGLTDLARKHSGQNVVAVSHGGSINAFLHRVTNGELGTGVTVIENTGVTQLVYRAQGRWDVLHVNETEHLVRSSTG